MAKRNAPIFESLENQAIEKTRAEKTRQALQPIPLITKTTMSVAKVQRHQN